MLIIMFTVLCYVPQCCGNAVIAAGSEYRSELRVNVLDSSVDNAGESCVFSFFICFTQVAEPTPESTSSHQVLGHLAQEAVRPMYSCVKRGKPSSTPRSLQRHLQLPKFQNH